MHVLHRHPQRIPIAPRSDPTRVHRRRFAAIAESVAARELSSAEFTRMQHCGVRRVGGVRS